jgi:hypothetical protein
LLEGGDTTKREKDPNAPKRRKKKDPNAPKGASTAFTLYCKATRNEMKVANPLSSSGDLIKLLSANFKTLTAEERADYDDKAAKDKARYHIEMAEYSSSKVASPESSVHKKEQAKSRHRALSNPVNHLCSNTNN